MKDASTAILKVDKGLGNGRQTETSSLFFGVRTCGRLDRDVSNFLGPVDAAVAVAQARLAFVIWAGVKHESLAQRYLYSLLFRDRS